MTPTQQRFNHIVAFEVSKNSLVVHVLPRDEQCTIANRRQAVRHLLQSELTLSQGPLLVVCEATGGYERHVLEIACQLDLACHRAHGTRVRFFAKYLGLAKTDPIDARMLALYGRTTERLRLYRSPTPEETALRALKDRREEILQMLIAENNRLEHATHRSVLASLRSHIRALKATLAALDKEIAALLRASPLLAAKAHLMQTLIGVGPTTATTCLAYLPELGHLTKGEAARLAGLAPIARDSGLSSAPRHIAPGRAALGRVLYMAALVAIRRNPVLAAFAARLKANGKPFKLIIVAVMRKLVITLNAILHQGKPWKHAKTA
jgi:transposase